MDLSILNLIVNILDWIIWNILKCELKQQWNIMVTSSLF